MMTTLDEFDLRILAEFQNDTRQPAQDIGDTVGLSASAVQRRLKRLREEGVIQAEIAIIAPSKIGRRLTAVVHVTLEREHQHVIEEFKAFARRTPEIMLAYYVAGESDFVLVVTARSMEEYAEFTNRFMIESANIRRFQTSFVLSPVKVGLALPIDDGDLVGADLPREG